MNYSNTSKSNKTNIRFIILLGFWLNLLAINIHAAPVTWYLDGLQFNTNTTATGSFIYDADTNTYSNINIFVTKGGNTNPYHVLDPTSGSNGFALNTVEQQLPDLTGQPFLKLLFDSQLNNAGGSRTITTGVGASSFQGFCQQPNCISIGGPIDFVTAGRVTTSLVWHLEGLQFNTGATAVGSFAYDAGTNTYSNINIFVTKGGNTNPYHVLNAGSGSNNSTVNVVEQILPDLTGQPHLKLLFDSQLSNAGGSSTITTATSSFQGFCLQATCNTFNAPFDDVTAGRLTTSLSPPTITSNATASVPENQTSAIDVQAIDDNDSEGAGLTFSLSGGVDQALFDIDANTGVVTFITAPDFEAAADAGTDNNYDIQVTVTDFGGLVASQDIVITVTDVLENITVSNTNDLENAPDLSSTTALVANDGGDGISLREAIAAANNTAGAININFSALFDTVQTINLTSNSHIAISTPMTITGPGANLLTIDAGNGTDNLPNTLDGFRIFRLFQPLSQQIDVSLSGFTLSGGDNNGLGGAIENFENLTLTDMTLSGNAAQQGGGIRTRGTLTLTGSTISGNSASSNGGGIFNTGSMTLTGSTISGNSAGSDGAGIDTNLGTMNMINSTISGNSASDDGGGICVDRGTLTVTNSTISGNSASDDGGGIFTQEATLTVTNSTISGNSASGDGGGIFSETELTGPLTTIMNVSISGNTAGDNGGGIYNEDGLTVIQLSTITGNTAANNQGSGVASYGDFATLTEVSHSIISGNTNEDVAIVENDINNSFQSNGYNLIGSGAVFNTGNTLDNFNQSGDQINVTNPLLGPLANNGGTTQTHALLSGSPAIDAGDPTAAAGVGNIPLFDQRGTGFSRVQLGHIDIGSFEYYNQAPSITSNATASVAENETAVHTLTATDVDLDPITFSILGVVSAGDLGTGQSLIAEESITSPDNSHTLLFQTDGNFVVYGPGGVVTWASG
ncbi:Alkaline phosphatase, partial [hydrothermal vent metagenome]